MNLNSIACGGYRQDENDVFFSLYDTTYDDVSKLNGQELILTIDDNNVVYFDGYSITSVNVLSDSINVRFTKKLNDETEKSIIALEKNYFSLRTLVDENEDNNSRTNSHILSAISPIIMRADLSDTEAVTLTDVYPEWQVGFDYKKDWIIRHNDDLYRIGQDHTSQGQWVPGADGTTALYSKIEITESGYEVWQEWDGVSGSYANGQIVQDPTDEKLYKSLIDNNVWGPPSEQPSYWELYEA